MQMLIDFYIVTKKPYTMLDIYNSMITYYKIINYNKLFWKLA